MQRGWLAVPVLLFVLPVLSVAQVHAQTPKPFPRPGDTAKPQPAAPPPARPADTQGVKVLPPADRTPVEPATGEPTEQSLGLPIYPGAQFIASYDAGRGQRYYLYGVNTDFAQVVAYYRTTLKQRGELVFEMPAIHMFDVGRFREESMAFPPGVTVKDYMPEGYTAFKGNVPVKYQTIVQFVPALPAAPGK
jgi:hypothetical protein